MSQVCDKHKEKPKKIYSQCVGCELEDLEFANNEWKIADKLWKETVENLVGENSKLLASEAVTFNENTRLKYECRKLREHLEKYMKRVKILLDGFDKIIDGEENPVLIAQETCAEAITVRR